MEASDHKKLGITYFNKTWDYIDLEERTKMQMMEMIHYSHASRLHWQLAGGTPLNLARGEWLISKVYNVLEKGESALCHGKESLRLIEENNIGDFDLVFAYETIAKAYKLLGNKEKVKIYRDLGYKNLDQIEKDGDRDYAKGELDKI